MDEFCIDSVNIDCIECIRDPCPVSTVLTYIVYSNTIVYCVCYLFFLTLSIRRSKNAMH